MLADIDTQSVQSATVTCAYGMRAYLALPEGPGPHPAVVLLHASDGLVQHTRDLALRLATDGNATICPDLFHHAPGQAELSSKETTLQDDLVVEDVDAAVSHLRRVPNVSADQLIVMGLGATGRYPLVLAARRDDLLACVVFYGGAGDPVPGVEPIDEVIPRARVPVLGVFGEADDGITPEHVHRFRTWLEQARRSYHIRVVPDAPHGFLDDTRPERYRRPQAEAAWRLLMDFLERARSGWYPPDRVRWAFEGTHRPNQGGST